MPHAPLRKDPALRLNLFEGRDEAGRRAVVSARAVVTGERSGRGDADLIPHLEPEAVHRLPLREQHAHDAVWKRRIPEVFERSVPFDLDLHPARRVVEHGEPGLVERERPRERRRRRVRHRHCDQQGESEECGQNPSHAETLLAMRVYGAPEFRSLQNRLLRARMMQLLTV